MSTDTTVRVFILSSSDDGTLEKALRAANDVEVVGQAEDLEAAASTLRRTNANVAVVDVRSHDTGIELCRDIRNRVEGVTCIVVSSFKGDEAMVDAILCGADDSLDLEGDVAAQLRAMCGGGRNGVQHFLDTARAQDVQGDDPVAQLTYRERTVVRHIVKGRTNREIGEELGLAEKTVRNYVSNILNKLHLDNRTQLAVHLARVLDEE